MEKIERDPTRSRKIVVITMPPWIGNTLLRRNLKSHFPHIGFPLSATTRAPREEEKDGVDYRFGSAEEFNMWQHNMLFEQSDVLRKKFGVFWDQLIGQNADRDLILTLNLEGYHALKRHDYTAKDVFGICVSCDNLSHIKFLLHLQTRGRKNHGPNEGEVYGALQIACDIEKHKDEFDAYIQCAPIEKIAEEVTAIISRVCQPPQQIVAT